MSNELNNTVEISNKTYSLYVYEYGRLKIFGGRSTRVKYSSIEDTKSAYKEYMTSRRKRNLLYNPKQVLILEYYGPYQTQIVEIISNTDIEQ